MLINYTRFIFTFCLFFSVLLLCNSNTCANSSNSFLTTESNKVSSQKDTILGKSNFLHSTYKIRASFLIVDNPARLNTMRQYSQNYFGAYLLVANTAYKTFHFKPAYYFLFGLSSILGVPLTHEEGHRSVLTHKNIGSISRPYFDSNGAAYVQGVTDNSLIELSDSDLPNYIRLHTGGLESDYMLSLRAEKHMAFNPHNHKLLYPEYLMRKMSLMQYYLTGLFQYDFDLEEEIDELKRDIVGHDVYGAVRHIHRPEMDFYRYTLYKDLTKEEKIMITRIGWRSLLNLVSPILYFKNGFKINPNVSYNFSLGYTMSPFGDFIDQNIWLNINKQNYHIYFRQHQNKNTWFPAAGGGVYDFPLGKKVLADANIHVWQQPKGLSFTENTGVFGGSFDVFIKYLVIPNISDRLKRISFDIGIVAKTEGFMPEEMELGRSVGARFGMSLYY